MTKIAGHLRFFAVLNSAEDAAPYLKKWLSEGDVILLKASRRIGLEKLIPLFIHNIKIYL